MQAMVRIVRLVLAGLVELVGFGLIIYAGMTLARWLGFALAGVIAIGVAIWLSPPDSAPDLNEPHEE